MIIYGMFYYDFFIMKYLLKLIKIGYYYINLNLIKNIYKKFYYFRIKSILI